MKQVNKKEYLLKLKLKKEDPVELPMDDQFFEDLHNRIMQAVDSTEMQPLTKWSKTRIFLERKAPNYKPWAKRLMKAGITGWVASIGLGLIGMSAQSHALAEHIKITRF